MRESVTDTVNMHCNTAQQTAYTFAQLCDMGVRVFVLVRNGIAASKEVSATLFTSILGIHLVNDVRYR